MKVESPGIPVIGIRNEGSAITQRIVDVPFVLLEMRRVILPEGRLQQDVCMDGFEHHFVGKHLDVEKSEDVRFMCMRIDAADGDDAPCPVQCVPSTQGFRRRCVDGPERMDETLELVVLGQLLGPFAHVVPDFDAVEFFGVPGLPGIRRMFREMIPFLVGMRDETDPSPILHASDVFLR